MSDKNIFIAKLRNVLIRYCVFGFSLFVLIQAQELTPKNDNVSQFNFSFNARQMFDGVNVEDIINYTINYDELCNRKQLYFKKDFTSPGRRISEAKCLEYIWDSMFKEYKVSRKQYCYTPVVVGGRSATYGEFPHMKEKHEIVPKYIPIKRIIKHGQYKAPSRYYDIALIELAEAMDIGAIIRPACLWSSSDTCPIDKLTVTGWGVVDPATRKASNELQVAEVNLVDDSTCDNALKDKHNRRWMGLAEHQICAGFLPGGVDTCQGDSGGPLQVKINFTRIWPMYYVVGVTSFGYGCARANTPSVYIKTSSFIDWIESIVWPNA